MSDRLKGLREKRGKIGQEMRDILDKATEEKRDPTTEELTKHGDLFDKQETLRQQIEAEERQVEIDREFAERKAAEDEETRKKANGGGDTPNDSSHQAFNNWLRSGNIIGDGADEFRALQADADTTGGYLVAPELFMAQLIKFVDDAVFVRGLANILPPLTSAGKSGVPALDTDISDADWTSELATGAEDSAMRIGKREMEPHPLAKRIKISNKLMRLGAIDPETLVRDRMGYKFGVTLEKAYLNGTGAGQPLGVFIASSDGISTGRDVSTGNTTTAIQFDGLIEAKYTLKSQYWPRARWMFHRDGMKGITQLKDGDGQYLWRPSVREGEPDTILGHPIMISEFAPNTFTTGLYVGLFADWSFYWIVDSLNFQIQRLVELYAEADQVGFIGRYEGDGAPVLEEAFVRVKLA